jgi:predicted N-acetyltransferase YhbS
MIRDASRADLPLIRDLFARANDMPYDLAAVAEEKCFGDGFTGSPRVRLFVAPPRSVAKRQEDAAEGGGATCGVAVTCGGALRILAVDRARRKRGIGSALLADSGANIIGAEAGNYFVPGVEPMMVNWLTKRGYREKSRTNNLTTDWLDYPIAPEIKRGDERALAFIEHYFGAIWAFECVRALRNDPPTLFVIEDAGRIVAFSAHEANNRGLGTFGPVGVAMDHRGRGLGRLLLHASLADLRRLGYQRAIIPWTGAIDFYEKSCNARVERQFVIMVRD